GRLEDCDPAEADRYGLKIGDAVIADIAVPCGECLLCRSGDDANCVNMGLTNGGSIDVAPYLYGGYTQVNYTPLTNLVKIPDVLNPTAVAAFACPGPTAIHAFRLAKQANMMPNGDTVAVVQGLGPVACFAILYLKALGVKKIIVVTAFYSEDKEELAHRLGADEVYFLSKTPEAEVIAELQKENNGLGVDLCFEGSGARAAFPFGLSVLRNRGVYLVPGQYSARGAVEIHPEVITFKALQILGSSQYSICDVRAYLDFLAANTELYDKIREMGTHFSVAQINEAIAYAKSGRNVKTLLVK
ncbi:MAG: zinc-binding dehydrogenase, partial [Clostridia bacterium]|nr:zinc-binding dehydrogenase [Clostridia bacterium]